MIQLLLIRDSIKSVVKKYNAAIVPIFRFVAAFITFLLINYNLGYNEKFSGISVVVMFSAISAFFPMAVTVFLAGLLMTIHIYSASMFLALIFVLIIAILYFMLVRFAPEYSGLIIAVPVLSFFHMEVLTPMAVGLTGNPIAIFAMVPGVIVSTLFNVIKEAVKMSAGNTQIEDNLQIYIYVMKSLIENKLMILTIVSSICVYFAAYVCRRLAISHAYILGILAGMIVNLMVMIIGGLILDVNTDVLWVFLGTMLSGVFAFVVQFFKYLLDYTSVEHLQFDDDDYFYYVTAVPKLSVTSPNLNILKINGNETDKE